MGLFMNINFVVLVFVGIFFSCLGLSILANFYFDISSDYLTATATFPPKGVNREGDKIVLYLIKNLSSIFCRLEFVLFSYI